MWIYILILIYENQITLSSSPTVSAHHQPCVEFVRPTFFRRPSALLLGRSFSISQNSTARPALGCTNANKVGFLDIITSDQQYILPILNDWQRVLDGLIWRFEQDRHYCPRCSRYLVQRQREKWAPSATDKNNQQNNPQGQSSQKWASRSHMGRQ